jgi:RNase H-like domain found in reverse transcriptase
MILAEINYDIHDKELLVIVTVLQEWRVYLKSFKYLIKMLTDHKNLT